MSNRAASIADKPDSATTSVATGAVNAGSTPAPKRTFSSATNTATNNTSALTTKSKKVKIAKRDIPGPPASPKPKTPKLSPDDNRTLLNSKPSTDFVTTGRPGNVEPNRDVSSEADVSAAEGATENNTAPSVDNGSATSVPKEVTMAPLYPVRELTPQITGRWAFIVRVLSRGLVREYTNLRGAGRMSEINVSDAAGDIIRVTLFNNAVTQFHDVLLPGASYYFSVGRVKLAAFAPAGATYEVTFGADAVIAPVEQGKEIRAEPSFQVTPLSQLAALTSRAVVTVAGIIHDVGNVKSTATAKGNTVDRRELALVDDSATKAFRTCWGHVARSCGESSKGRPLLIIGALVSDHNGSRSLNIGFGATVLFDVDVVKTRQLTAWYQALPTNFAFTTIGA